jgi:two-component system sensor histidine kinase VicK
VSLTISPIKDSEGKVIGLSNISRDITDKKREETRKNDFIAMVSHELKTPLTSISSYIQFLLAKEADEGKHRILERAELQTKKMGKMIQDFLTMARIGESKFKIQTGNFNLKPVMDDVVHEAQLLTSNHTIRVENCDQEVHADKDKIGQVIVNLINNAIKYSPEGGDIVVGCGKKGKKVKVYVKDEGVGITENDQKNLFERFYRVENEKIQNVAGFGIGLYLVAEILKHHGSKISVESTEGKGSTFCFLLDAAKE